MTKYAALIFCLIPIVSLAFSYDQELDKNVAKYSPIFPNAKNDYKSVNDTNSASCVGIIEYFELIAKQKKRDMPTEIDGIKEKCKKPLLSKDEHKTLTSTQSSSDTMVKAFFGGCSLGAMYWLESLPKTQLKKTEKNFEEQLLQNARYISMCYLPPNGHHFLALNSHPSSPVKNWSFSHSVTV